VAESLSFDRIADRYDETRGGLSGEGTPLRSWTASSIWGRSPSRWGWVPAWWAMAWPSSATWVVGVDLSPAMAARAVERIGPRVAVADARRLPVGGGRFDQAYSVWVLHLVGDVPGVLAEVARVLRPGGRYVVVPAYRHDADTLDRMGSLFQEMWDALDPEGIRRDDEERLRELAASAGLRLEDAFRGPDMVRRESPATLIENIEERVFSILWDVDDERWRRHVEPVLQELRQLPDPEVPIDRPLPFDVVVLERV
jgi:SAM-dependent methyltransferase